MKMSCSQKRTGCDHLCPQVRLQFVQATCASKCMHGQHARKSARA